MSSNTTLNTKLLNTEQTKHECSASSLMMMYFNLNSF